MSVKPRWWPKNPYPKTVFTMERDKYAEIVPDEKTRTALSGMLGREFWDIASNSIWEIVEQQLAEKKKEVEKLSQSKIPKEDGRSSYLQMAGAWEDIYEQIKSMGLWDWPMMNKKLALIDNCVDFLKELEAENKKLKGLLSQAQCPNCDGSGCIPKQVSSEQRVTRDMASDAGDMALEGSLYSRDRWEAEQCQWCYEKEQALGGGE